MKKLLLTLTLLLTLGFAAGAAEAETISENFKDAAWMTKTSSTVTTNATTETSSTTDITYTYINTYRNSSFGIILKGAAKNTGSISFTLPGNASKITIKSGSGISEYAAVDILAGETVISANLAVGTKSTEYSVEIPSANQAEGTVYKIVAVKKSGDTKYRNIQIESLTYTITKGDPSDTREVFSYEGFKDYTLPVEDVEEFALPDEHPTITYTSSNNEIAEADEAGIYAYAPGTATITASWEGDETFKPGSATFTVTVVDAANSIAELREKAAAKGDKIYVNFPMTVTYVNGKYNYVTDGNGGFTLLYDNKNLYELNANDVIPAGWTAVNCLFNGLEEYDVDGSLPEITEQGEYTPRAVNLADITNDMINEIVIIKDVNFAAATESDTSNNFNGTNGEEATFTFRNTFKVASVEAGNYDVLGAISFYAKSGEDGNIQILPIEYTALPTLVISDVTIKHGKVAGVITVDYTFEIANHNGNELDVTATLEGNSDVKFVKVETPAAAPARAAGENATFKGTLKATHESLKGAQPLSVNIKATLDGKELYNKTETDIPTTGIEDVTVEGNEAAEYFNLQGIRMAEPQAGQVYIVRRGAKTTKELVK